MIKIGASYSTLSTTELLNDLVPQYRVESPISCKFWCRGINDSYKVSSEEKNYLLRIYRKGWRTLSQINFEVEALTYLHDKGANISYPIKRNDGGYVTTLNTPEGLRYALVTTYVEGEDISYDDVEDAYLYGQNVADIHSLSTDFSTQHSRFELDKVHLLNEPIDNIKPFLSHRPDDWKFIEKLRARLLDIIQNINREDIDYGFCHGDFHGGNAHKTANTITYFDFDCCGFGWRAYDIAVFRWGARLHDKEADRWKAFVQGYKTKRDISDVDLKLTTAFLAIRDIWLMGLHMGNANDFGRDWIDDCYIDRRINFLKLIIEEHFI